MRREGNAHLNCEEEMSEKEEVNLIDKAKWERRYLNLLREKEDERKGIIVGWIYCEETVGEGMKTWKKRWFSLCFQYLSFFKRNNGLI